MDEIIKKIEEIISLMGFNEGRFEVNVDKEHRKIMIKIDDESIRDKNAPQVMAAFDLIVNQILSKHGLEHCVVDLNYYRKERERLITELARAAIKKARITKEDVELPTMNSYERRLVHMEISTHPEMETESIGQGKERRVVIKHIKE